MTVQPRQNVLERPVSLMDELYGEPGYSTRYRLSDDELKFLRDSVNKCFQARMSEFIDVPANLTVDKYHTIDTPDHETVWQKDARFLPQSDVDVIKNFGFLKAIEQELGPFHISKRVDQDGNVSVKEEEIYWRLVRPNCPSDVGQLHADIWFADAMSYTDSLLGGQESLKAWIPLYVQRNQSGLAVVENSHKVDWEYSIVANSNGHQRPRVQSDVSGKLVPTDAGDILLFGENLLHGGTVNKSDFCRVSMEITMVFEKPLAKPLSV